MPKPHLPPEDAPLTLRSLRTYLSGFGTHIVGQTGKRCPVSVLERQILATVEAEVSRELKAMSGAAS